MSLSLAQLKLLHQVDEADQYFETMEEWDRVRGGKPHLPEEETWTQN